MHDGGGRDRPGTAVLSDRMRAATPYSRDGKSVFADWSGMERHSGLLGVGLNLIG